MAGTRGCALLLALLQAQRARAPDVEALRARSCNFQTWDVPEQGPLPKEKFLSLFPAGVPLEGKGPLLVRGGAAASPVVSGAGRWTAAHLAEVVGGVKLDALEHTATTSGGLFHYVRGGPTHPTTLGEFVATRGVNQTEYGDDYVFQRVAGMGKEWTAPEWRGVQKEFEAPEWTGADIGSQEAFFSIGPVGSGLTFHQHGEAWNVITSGAKWWVIFDEKPFEAVENAGKSRGIAVRNAGEDGDLMAAWLDGTAPNTPPGFDKGWECVQEAGDIVFVPREWFHAVVNLDDDTVSVAGQPNGDILGNWVTRNGKHELLHGAQIVGYNKIAPKKKKPTGALNEADFLQNIAPKLALRRGKLTDLTPQQIFQRYDEDHNHLLDKKELKKVYSLLTEGL